MTNLATFILKIFGWRVEKQTPESIDRCVMIAAPHTSNWDLVIARLAFYVLKVPLRFTIKQEWMVFPVGPFIRLLGAIPIDRSPKLEGDQRKSMVEAMTDLFKDRKRLAIMITPEGTRSRREKWKTGFYHVAKGAGVPIALGFLDYKNKIAGVGPVLYPGADMTEDMRRIMDFYRDITPRHKDKFSIDLEYQ